MKSAVTNETCFGVMRLYSSTMQQTFYARDTHGWRTKGNFNTWTTQQGTLFENRERWHSDAKFIRLNGEHKTKDESVRDATSLVIITSASKTLHEKSSTY